MPAYPRRVRLGVVLVVLLGFAALIGAAGITPIALADNNTACYSICKYRDSKEHLYLGLSAGNCTDACNDAKRKCIRNSKVGGCSKLGDCTSAGCG